MPLPQSSMGLQPFITSVSRYFDLHLSQNCRGYTNENFFSLRNFLSGGLPRKQESGFCSDDILRLLKRPLLPSLNFRVQNISFMFVWNQNNIKILWLTKVNAFCILFWILNKAKAILTDLWSSISLISETGSLKKTGRGPPSEIGKLSASSTWQRETGGPKISGQSLL